MDDSPTDIGVPPAGLGEVLSDSQPAEPIKINETIIKTEDALVLPPSGSRQRKIEANRRNAKKSTGPKTARGKAMSAWNSRRHGLLSKNLPLIYGRSKKHFARLLANLQRDLEPVGTLEEVLVEKIAQEYWRLGVAAWHEAEAFTRENPFLRSQLSKISRYQTTINRQLFQAMNELERLQRLRKGDVVPAPLNLQVLTDTPPISENHDTQTLEE